MAKKKVSETIKQQRKAQKDFLELKKMQSGEMDAGPKPSDVEIKQKTFLEKLKNLWFHDKGIILIGAALALMFTLFTVQCASQTRPDLQVVVFTYSPILDESCEKMSEYLRSYAEDINGDGEVYVKVINCSYDKENADYFIASNRKTRLSATIAGEANALLFITDDASHRDIAEQFKDDGGFFIGNKVYLNNDFHQKCKLNEKLSLPNDLSISLRRIKDTMIEIDDNAQKYFDLSKEIQNRLNTKSNKMP